LPFCGRSPKPAPPKGAFTLPASTFQPFLSACEGRL
jgi:hypothetical protein